MIKNDFNLNFEDLVIKIDSGIDRPKKTDMFRFKNYVIPGCRFFL